MWAVAKRPDQIDCPSQPSASSLPAAIAAVRPAVSAGADRTPSLRPPALDERLGARIALKAENLQRAGSFKIRGATAKLAQLGDEAERGVVAASAGNHGRALAWAARERGIACELFVPEEAPVSKTEPARRLGAKLTPCKGTVDDCLGLARGRAEEAGMTFVHPFDDPEVIAGQGTIGLELVEEIDDLARIVVPLGGGGLASGIAIAAKAQRPEIEVIGVQVEACAAWVRSLDRGEPVAVDARYTIADGIAVKRPGEVTLPLVERWLDGVVVVGDDDVADAMSMLLSEAKLVVEGAGAVGLAALLTGAARPATAGTTAIVLSGGNVDEQVLVAVARRSEAAQGRGVALYTKIADRPGSLARLLEAVADAGASVLDVRHVREAVDLHIAETGVELLLETRGPDHTERVLGELRGEGYEVGVQHG